MKTDQVRVERSYCQGCRSEILSESGMLCVACSTAYEQARSQPRPMHVTKIRIEVGAIDGNQKRTIECEQKFGPKDVRTLPVEFDHRISTLLRNHVVSIQHLLGVHPKGG